IDLPRSRDRRHLKRRRFRPARKRRRPLRREVGSRAVSLVDYLAHNHHAPRTFYRLILRSALLRVSPRMATGSAMPAAILGEAQQRGSAEDEVRNAGYLPPLCTTAISFKRPRRAFAHLPALA